MPGFGFSFEFGNVLVAGGGPAPSAPTLVSAAVIGWQGAGDGHVGDVLEIVTASVWTGADTITQQWQNYNGSDWVDNGGATGSTYTIVEDDASLPIRLVETAHNGAGDTAADPSNSLTASALSSPSNLTAPVIFYGSPFTANIQNNGTWEGNPVPGTGYSYQWQAYITGSWTDIPGEVGATIAWITGSGDDLRCMVTAYNSQGPASKESNPLS